MSYTSCKSSDSFQFTCLYKFPLKNLFFCDINCNCLYKFSPSYYCFFGFDNNIFQLAFFIKKLCIIGIKTVFKNIFYMSVNTVLFSGPAIPVKPEALKSCSSKPYNSHAFLLKLIILSSLIS